MDGRAYLIPMTEPDPVQERERLAALAIELAAKNGVETTRNMLAAELGVSPARIAALFADEDDLFEAALEKWFSPLIAIMDDVMGSDLPANRKMYEFVARRFSYLEQEYRRDPKAFAILQDVGNRRFDRVETYIDLADHYTCELIAQAQDEGAFAGLSIERALSLINQALFVYTTPEMLITLGEKLTLDKLASLIDALFAGLSASDGGAGGTTGLRAA